MEGPETTLQEVEYPVRDGQPMGETDRHRDEMWDSIHVLRDHFRDDPLVYVSGNNFVYYQRGVPSAVVSPDTYLVRGVPPGQRDTFKVWEEGGHRPCFALEIISKTTRQVDLGDKMSRYRDDLQVPEYFLFDPFGDWLPEHLRGYELRAGEYQRLRALPNGRLLSRQLGLELGVHEGRLRYFLPGAAAPLPTPTERADEVQRRADEVQRRADNEQRRAEAAEAEVARLRAELERMRGRLGPQPGELSGP